MLLAVYLAQFEATVEAASAPAASVTSLTVDQIEEWRLDYITVLGLVDVITYDDNDIQVLGLLQRRYGFPSG